MIDSAAGLRRILGECRIVAVVGLSADVRRPSRQTAEYLLKHGYEVVPINPLHSEILGRKCYPDLASAPRADIADCFRRTEAMPELAGMAAAAGARVFWMQLGVCCPAAAKIAEDAGMETVGNRCIKIEHEKLFGGREINA